MAVEEQAPPLSVETWLPKKYFSSYKQRGVIMYFCVVTREMVDSCSSTASAISRSTNGRIATSPCSKNCFWRSTLFCVLCRMVSKRCCTILISQRASCSWLVCWLLLLLWWCVWLLVLLWLLCCLGLVLV